jgi:Uma2 family endonuclease
MSRPTGAVAAEQLWRLGSGDIRRELVDGAIVEMTPAGGVHGRLTGRIFRKLDEFVERHGGGAVVAGDVAFDLALPKHPERIRAPDVAFVCAARLSDGRLTENLLRGAPDLAVEVLSPADDPIQIQQKVSDYLAAGARLVWVVAPRFQTVTIFRRDGSAHLLREPEVLDGDEVLAGFTLSVGELFW